MSLRATPPALSLTRMRARCGPLALLVMAAMLLSLAPRRARAAEPEPEERETATAPLAPAVAEPPGVERSERAVRPQLVEPSRRTAAQPPETTVMSLPTGENKTGVSSKAISTPSGPGTLQGMGESFSAQPSTGIATFSVPFALPKARGAAQPSLSLGYGSSSGSGVAGVGWDVSVPSISRQTDRGLPAYQDQDAWHPNQDRFVYNGGQELVPIATPIEGEELPSWAHGWQYFRPRVEGSYLRFFWNRSLQSWRVQDKSGVVLELGGESNALETEPGNPSRVFRWNLRRQLDAFGNEVRYSYLHDGGTAYLQDIHDTSPAAGDTGLTQWAHHTRLVYETRLDPSTSFHRGWKVSRSLRLARVDVTSVASAGAGRELLRRYHLGYDDAYHVSLLASVQVEGRCEGQSIPEQSDGTLPGSACPRLPAMRFGYSHVGQPTPDGWEPIDSTVRSMQGSPKHSVDEDSTDLYDVNGDGLPDIVAMMPGSYGGRHGLWLNSAAGEADRFGPQTSLGVQGVLGGTESVLTKHNPNVAALDLDGDATIELVHMPKAKSYGVYTPRLIGSSWWWVGRAVTTADKLDAKIDFGTDAAELRVFDVNGDGLVDVVKTGGTSMQVWFALGRYPGGDGLFGSAQWTGADTAALSMNPVLRCVPWSATPVRFSDEDTRLADMNGDGLTDIVRVRQGDVKYWPGRGDGTFGTGELGCAGSTFSQGTFVQMASSPQYSDPNGSALHVDDVNGDGLSDLVQIRFNAVDVWLNVDGSRWTGRTVLSGTPASPGYQNRVRLVDMNGSGTRDILWGDGYAYKYIDLAAGQRPWLLTSIANGLGKTTEVQFTTSSAQMIAAEKGGKPWSRRAPIPLHMVSQVTVRDNLGAVGRPSGAYTTRYTYRDPVYDGLQREFRGFSRTEIETAGDANSPASVSSTEFLLGERPADHHGIDYTLPENRWRDNPREALKGLATVGESWDAKSKVYLSTTHASYRLRKLYSGKDGRSVWTAFEAGSDSLLYDTGAWVANGTTLSLPSIAIEDCSTSACTEDGSLAASVPARAAYVHVRKTVEVDRFGNRTVETAWGRVGTDESIVSETIPARVPTPDHALGEGGWAWRTVESRIRGSVHTAERRRTRTDYDGRGNPVETRAWLGDAGGLDRSGPDGTEAGTAPFPPTASPPGFSGWILTSHTWYDGFGNAVFETGAEGRCRAVGYDDAYRHLPTSETTYAGLADAEPVEREIGGISVSAACGTTELTTHAEYDLGLQALTSAVDPSGARTGVVYDGFGRMRELYAPSSWIAWESSVVPSLRVDYHLPDETGRPVSLLVSKTQDGADEGVADYHETYAFVDGLGRTVVTLSEADPGHDGFGWVVEGLTDYDQKGAPRRKYLAWEYSGPPEDYDLSMPSASKYGQQRYDAFGRAVETFGLDGRVTLRTRYHALSSDAWDAEDIGPGPHQGTFASEEKDGHGRVIRTTERVRVAQGIDTRHVESAYLPTGEVTSITRSHSGASVARTMAYDTLGRMTDNVAPETSSGQRWWRYVYDQAGDLVGTSDARGCGVNYGYDAAGRLVSEDYSPCQPNHEPYDAVPEVSYRYDEVDSEPDCLVDQGFTAGKLVSVTDRASKAVTQYDGRGRIQAAARRVNGPDGETGTRWYCKATAYDGANRPVLEQTGTDPPTEVITSYTRRGAVGSIGSTYGALVERVRRDADGLVTEIGYGDAAHTTTGFDYDDLRRLRNLTTYRAALPAGTPSETGQMLLQDEQYSYDRVGNPIEIRDYRIASEWAGAPAPVTRKMQYDDLYRLTRIDYQYPGGQDPWRDPYEAEQGVAAPHAKSPSRVLQQTWSYDWLGNSVASNDDAGVFYDRSLGQVTNSGYRLTSAKQSDQKKLQASYDAAGHMTELVVERGGVECVPAGDKCELQRYRYEWDEVGRLMRARRWDQPNPEVVPDAELQFAYDASDARVRKSVVAPSGVRHSVYVFHSLELRQAPWDGSDYERTEATEVPYLFGHGVRLARVVHTAAPDFTAPSVRVYLELGDHLGSTSVVLDRATGELVERGTAYAYGAAESEYRPQRWDQFREEYRFTGKEDDIEVGLIYFGARYLNPQLGRWISADPLAVHAPGKADLNLYAYVHGKVLSAVDPVGLCEAEGTGGACPPPGEQSRAGGTAEPTDTKPEAQPPPAPTGPSVGAQGGGNSDPYAQAAQQKAETQKQQTVSTAMQKLPSSMQKPDQLTPLWKGDQVGGWLYRTSPWQSSGDYYQHDTSGQRLGYAGEKPLIRDYTVDVAGPPLVTGAARLGAGIVNRLVLKAPSVGAGVAEGLAARGGTRAAEEMITLHHGSVSDYTEILTSGLKASRAPTWVTTEMTAARNAIGPGRVMSPGQGLNKGVITSTVPRAQFEALQEAGAISNLRTWPGFGGGQTFTEFVLRKPAAFDLFNAGIVR